MLAIETNDLTKNFGDFKAVDNLNLKVPKGTIYGFIGKNGAGKTTTINMLLGLKKVSNGDIKLLGEEISFNDYGYKHDIGFVSDVPEFYGWMKPYEYLKFCSDIFKIDKVEAKSRINELLEFVGLDDVNRNISSFSRGMKQRLGIAVALINDPKVVIMDEPTSALDPIGRKEIMDIIIKLKGIKTIFYSTHILDDVERVCDMVGIIDHGKLIIEDTLSNLKETYYEAKIYLRTDKSNEIVKPVLENEDWYIDSEDYNGGLIVKVTDINEVEKNILRIMRENNWSLKEFRKIEQTLEDIFLKVTNEC